MVPNQFNFFSLLNPSLIKLQFLIAYEDGESHNIFSFL